ncbi:MAG: hypothetical protein ACT4QC_12110 [Planctomycetaceae bacterium]
MAADRQARTNLRDALVAYMRGEIRTFAFDDRNSVYFGQRRTEDRSVLEISHALWTIHDDFIDHPISVASEGWMVLQRVVAFLATDLEASAVTKPLAPSWPFRDESEWLAHERFSRSCLLPEYDAQLHGRRFQPWWNRIPAPVGIAVILGFLALTILAFAFATGRW